MMVLDADVRKLINLDTLIVVISSVECKLSAGDDLIDVVVFFV